MGFEGNKVESQGKEKFGFKDFSSNDHKYFDGKSLKSKKSFKQDLIRHKIRNSAMKNFDEGRCSNYSGKRHYAWNFPLWKPAGTYEKMEHKF